jgi:hypothetical protein
MYLSVDLPARVSIFPGYLAIYAVPAQKCSSIPFGPARAGKNNPVTNDRPAQLRHGRPIEHHLLFLGHLENVHKCPIPIVEPIRHYLEADCDIGTR